MYCYKLNNSYTVYVNHVYLNECIKASKKIKKDYADSYVASAAKIFTPLIPDTRLKHKIYGIGKVISTSVDGIMDVAFANKVARFQYPEAVHKGFLARVY